jgi:hypothetical protein
MTPARRMAIRFSLDTADPAWIFSVELTRRREMSFTDGSDR